MDGTKSDWLTLDIWGSSVPAFLEDHLHHQTAPEARQRRAGVTWKGWNEQRQISNGFKAPFMEVYWLIMHAGLFKFQLYLRSKQEDALVAPIQGLSGRRFGCKLDNALACGAATVVYDDDGSLDHSELRESFFQELVGHKRRQILHGQSSGVCGKTDAQGSAFHRRIVQLCFCYLCKSTRLLRETKLTITLLTLRSI